MSREMIDRPVFLRGLIELSNICRKDCLYCGIRKSNDNVDRYELTDSQVLELSRFALENGYGSVVLQGGERCDKAFTSRISGLVSSIKSLRYANHPPLGITLSFGEQTEEVYKEWLDAGAHRYLLRIETSNRDLYGKIHPEQSEHDRMVHSFDNRLEALRNLKRLGYVTGSGIMIGLPFQTMQDLEKDLDFLQDFGVDMVGMGPYIPHRDTPLGRMVADPAFRDPGDFQYYTDVQRLELCLGMISRLRRRMPHINIAATTALQVLAEDGRERGILAGANVIMPNLTVTPMRRNYQLYEGKSDLGDDAASTRKNLEKNLAAIGARIEWFTPGDPECVKK